MILVLEYEGETKKSKEDILMDAENINKKLGGDQKICRLEDEFREYMKSPSSKDEVKLHIVCHGNEQVVGNYNAAALGNFLWESGLKTRSKIKKITLQSCDSGVERVRPDNNSWTPSLAWQLASYFSSKPAAAGMIVRGSDGHTITDSEGHNWVLIQELPRKPRTRQDEINLLTQYTRPRATARPKFAAIKGGGVGSR
jgi:hypothetical protein